MKNSEKPLSEQEITTAVQGAFRPLSCVAKREDHGEKLKVRVRDKNGVIQLEVHCHDPDSLSDKRKLDSFLQEMRESIKSKGIALDPWKMG